MRVAGADRNQPDRLAGIGIIRQLELPVSRLASERTPETEVEMVDALAKVIDLQAGSGAFAGSVLLTRNGEVLLAKAYGAANREADIANTMNTPFHIGSAGKMFTAVLVGQFVAEGLLTPETRVGEIIPDYPSAAVRDHVTVAQLLTHQAGLGTFFQSPGYERERRYPNAISEMAVYGSEPLYFDPGTAYRYSNAGFSLLAAMLETVSGNDFPELVSERILEPAGMSRTYLASDHPRMRSAALMYAPAETDPLGLDASVPLSSADPGAPTDAVQGFGGGYSSVVDMQRFLSALTQNTLLPEAQFTEMISQRVEQEPNTGRHYGYGIERSVISGQTMIGYGGAGRFDVRHLIESGYTLTISTNRTPPSVAAISLPIMAFVARYASANGAGAEHPASRPRKGVASRSTDTLRLSAGSTLGDELLDSVREFGESR